MTEEVIGGQTVLTLRVRACVCVCVCIYVYVCLRAPSTEQQESALWVREGGGGKERVSVAPAHLFLEAQGVHEEKELR
jgi:hypothetical protein